MYTLHPLHLLIAIVIVIDIVVWEVNDVKENPERSALHVIFISIMTWVWFWLFTEL